MRAARRIAAPWHRRRRHGGADDAQLAHRARADAGVPLARRHVVPDQLALQARRAALHPRRLRRQAVRRRRGAAARAACGGAAGACPRPTARGRRGRAAARGRSGSACATRRRRAADAARTPRGPMLYTSGTTGRPKGIRRDAATPQQVARTVEKSRLCYGIEPGMRALLNAPMYHSAPNAYAIGVTQIARRHAAARAALRCRAHAAADRAAPPHPRLPRAHAVRAPAAPARCGEAQVRRELDAPRERHRLGLPAGRQARDDRLVGSGVQRGLRFERARLHDLRDERRGAGQARHRRACARRRAS